MGSEDKWCVITTGSDNDLDRFERFWFLVTCHFMLHVNDLFVYSWKLSYDDLLFPCQSNFGRQNTRYFFILKEKKKIQVYLYLYLINQLQSFYVRHDSMRFKSWTIKITVDMYCSPGDFINENSSSIVGFHVLTSSIPALTVLIASCKFFSFLPFFSCNSF